MFNIYIRICSLDVQYLHKDITHYDPSNFKLLQYNNESVDRLQNVNPQNIKLGNKRFLIICNIFSIYACVRI